MTDGPTDASETTTEPTTEAGPAPPATEQVTAGELNHRDRVLWPVNGRVMEFRVTGVQKIEFGGRLVAYRLNLWADGHGPEQADVTPDDPITRIVEAPVTRRDLSLFSIRHGLDLTPAEKDTAEDFANTDPDEGREWLPYYKAALGLLAEMAGMMAGHLHAGRRPTPEAVAEMRRLWFLHLVLAGVGPTAPGEDAAARVEFARVEADDAFAMFELVPLVVAPAATSLEESPCST